MTPFDDYLGKLQGDDEELKAFLADPHAAGDKAGLSKAERATLRRVLMGASTASTNGYGIVRPLAAYRQGVRMLQNTLHRSMGAAMATAAGASNAMYVYYSGDPANPSVGPYGNYVYYYGTGSTIGELMQNIVKSGQSLIYADSTLSYPQQGPFIGSFTINGGVYDAPPPQTTQDKGIPFWFYSVNGLPGPNTSGGNGESYFNHAIKPNDVVYWQDIAPGPQYGFQTCDPSSGAHTMGLV